MKSLKGRVSQGISTSSDPTMKTLLRDMQGMPSEPAICRQVLDCPQMAPRTYRVCSFPVYPV